jgi:hypothetical protein
MEYPFLRVRIEMDDNQGRVDHTWIGDKILFVEVWWGRIAWTDFVLDTKTLRFLYIEDGRDDFVPQNELDTLP